MRWFWLHIAWGSGRPNCKTCSCCKWLAAEFNLFAGATKNGKARRVAMPDDVRAAVELCCNGRAPDAHVFTWPGGRRILDFRAAWAKATAAAKVPGLLFHDLRRSAARRMVRAGLPVATAMKITGHLTRQVFDSYDVSGDADLLEAAKLL